MAQDIVQTYYDPLFGGTHDLQELANTYFQITLARTRLQHSLLLHYIPLYFPEFARYWLSTRSAWFIRFLLRFPTAAAIRALDFEAFMPEAWDLIGRKVAKRELSSQRLMPWRLKALACQSRSIRPPSTCSGSSCRAIWN